MTVYEAVKQISCNDAAQRLGLKGKRVSAGKGMWCCPFHEDTSPSMCCFERDNRFYCFSCHARGDAADLFAKVRGLPPVEAAREALREFNLEIPGGCDRPRGQAQAILVRQDVVRKAVRAVREEYRRGMLILLTGRADGMVAAMEKSPDPDGWLWNRALQHACRNQEEFARWDAMSDDDVAAYIRESLLANRLPAWGEDLPTPGRVLFREILDELECQEKFPKLNLSEVEAVLNELTMVGPPKEVA